MKITTSSSKKNLQYIESSGKFYIQVDNMIPSWQTGFSSIECAKIFASAHEILATDDMPYNEDDFAWIVDTYGFEYDENNMWVRTKDELTYVLEPDVEELVLTVFGEKVSDVYLGVDNILKKLDEDFPDIFACTQVIGQLGLRSILAASAREVTKNMVRVRSSNIWSYCINIKDAKSKYGDVYVQFKGRNGGPTGGVYVYYDVPVTLWRKWLTANSKGHFFWVYIRNNYKYSKLDGNKHGVLPNAINH